MQDANPAGRPEFRSKKPRTLLLTSQYFLLGELRAACERLEVPHRLLDLQAREMAMEDFVAVMAKVMSEFRPDLVLTVNHLGVDREGVLAEVLSRVDTPLVSWFVDNPLLILPLHHNLHAARTALFSWDADNLDDLRAMGFENVFHLPLAADPTRFRPKADTPREDWRARVSFVGNSMVLKTHKRLAAAAPGPILARAVPGLARAFSESEERSVRALIQGEFPELWPEFEALGEEARKLALETCVTWLATLEYRLECLAGILGFGPIIAGDPGWKELLGGVPGWRYLPELAYYDELPDFYPLSEVNFNCTSKQMKGAVNQRVFDVPSCGAFLITDRRRQIEDLFEPGQEVVLYDEPAEVFDLVRRYLADPGARRRVVEAARKRVLAEHTYDRRLAELLETARQCFG
ncbi:MAG: glycosyltransferase [Desulfovibrionaceae bacterium]|nr:glycosyltransferase [Desulfovibrionaceae bacterium]